MANSPEIEKRIAFPRNELETESRSAHVRAKVDHWTSVILMLFALVASGVAGIGGLSKAFSATTTGAIAFLPGLLMLVATILNFEGKSGWHYRKKHRLDDLRDQLVLQLPESPNADQIAQLSKKRNKCIFKMQEEWEKKFSLNWSRVSQGSHKELE